MSLRILQVIPSVAAVEGGPTRAISVIERALRERGVSVTTLTTDYRLDREALDAGALQPRILVHLWTRHYKIAPSMLPYLWRFGGDFDVIHIHGLFSFAPTVAAWSARAHGTPYIVRPLGTLNKYGVLHRRPYLKRISIACNERLILRHASAVHFTSRAEEREASEQGLTFRSAIIPLAVIDDVPMVAAASLGPAMAGRRIILFLSRLDPKKNMECLIDAIAASQRLKQQCGLVVAGDGEAGYVALLKARAEAAGIAESIEWLGHVDKERKAAAFAAADVFVLPSHSENFGIAAVEAMFAGLPCILTPGVAVAREAAAAGGAEIVCASPAALAGAIERVTFDDARRIEMGALAMAYARKEFSVDVMAERLVDLYREIKRRRSEIVGAVNR